MQNRVITYTVLRSPSGGTSLNPLDRLRQAVVDRGDHVVGTFIDHGPEVRLRQRNTGWRSVFASLNDIDQVAILSAADLPGKTVRDLLKLLDVLRDHGVGLYLLTEGIETGSSYGDGVLDMIQAFRRAKLSQAIRKGQAKAVARGRVIGRPAISPGLQARIEAALAHGGGIRPTARKFKVSPASVINIRHTMVARHVADAA